MNFYIMTDLEFTDLIKQNEDFLTRSCIKRCFYDVDKAQMLKSQILEKLWNWRAKYNTSGKNVDFRAWIVYIIKFTIIDNYRWDKHSKNVPLEIKHNSNNLTDCPAQKLSNQQHIERLLMLIKQKHASAPMPYKVFMYCIVEGRPYQEAVEEFNIPMSSIKTYICNIRKFIIKYKHHD